MKQATLIIGLACVGFAVGLAAFIGSRLSEQAVALMAGAVFGMLVALPIGLVAGWFIRSQRQSTDRAANAQPMVIMTPQAPQMAMNGQPYLNAAPNAAWPGNYSINMNTPQLQPRKYTIGGEEIVTYDADTVR
ncbi:MAG: hypothetical protein U0559_20530 [Anaerolineae bacterium]